MSSGAAPPESGECTSGWCLGLAPTGDLYGANLAGSHHSRSGIQMMSFSRVGIDDAGESRFGLALGGRFGILRLHRHDDPDGGLQVGIEGGFRGEFDRDRSQDNIGWDGLYGLTLTYRGRGKTAFKLGLHHTSSHVGDEYIEATGRARIDYTRNEIEGGMSRRFGRRWRVYAETGWGVDLRNQALQEEWRGQAGAEYRSSRRWWKGIGVYAASDVSTWEERDWSADVAVQVGLLLDALPRRWRFGVEYYDGRARIGEFFQDDERAFSLGLWLDP